MYKHLIHVYDSWVWLWSL